jgi:hypothetical protein
VFVFFGLPGFGLRSLLRQTETLSTHPTDPHPYKHQARNSAQTFEGCPCGQFTASARLAYSSPDLKKEQTLRDANSCAVRLCPCLFFQMVAKYAPSEKSAGLAKALQIGNTGRQKASIHIRVKAGARARKLVL